MEFHFHKFLPTYTSCGISRTIRSSSVLTIESMVYRDSKRRT